jgi:hypothetical protein
MARAVKQPPGGVVAPTQLVRDRSLAVKLADVDVTIEVDDFVFR